MIAAGMTAPDFTLPVQTGGSLTLSALRPKRVVLFFYPKDMTPACTTEATGFQARAAAFARAGARLVGVSKDSLTRHQSFAGKQGLTLPLCSDAESDVCETWGVWAEKTLYGRRFMGIVRSTFLVGPTGIIERVWSPVKVPGHVEEVLAAVKSAKSAAAA